MYNENFRMMGWTPFEGIWRSLLRGAGSNTLSLLPQPVAYGLPCACILQSCRRFSCEHLPIHPKIVEPMFLNFPNESQRSLPNELPIPTSAANLTSCQIDTQLESCALVVRFGLWLEIMRRRYQNLLHDLGLLPAPLACVCFHHHIAPKRSCLACLMTARQSSFQEE